MDIDLDRWRRLRLAEANAADDGPSFIQLQQANDRRARARDQLARFRAQGPRGNANPPIYRAARAGEQILAGVGTSSDDVMGAFNRSVAELEQRVAAAEAESTRLAERLAECNTRRNALHHLIEEIRRWAGEQSPAITLPGDGGRLVPPPGLPGARSVHVPAAPAGSRDFLTGRPA